MIDRNRLATYLDEAGDEPAAGCATLQRCGISHVCLRQLWAGNVLNATDQALQQVRGLLRRHGLSVASLQLDLGREPPENLAAVPRSQVDRAFLLADYFGTGLVRFYAGTATNRTPERDRDALVWMSELDERATAANKRLLLETTHDTYWTTAADIAAGVAQLKSWWVQYDPAQLAVRRLLDPFTEYWVLLKEKVAMFDLHDVKIGQGFRPPGQGDCRLDVTLADAEADGYTGWYVLEPGLGRRYGSALRRQDTFALAWEALVLLMH